MCQTSKRVGFSGGNECYACDARPVGFRDQRPEGGELVKACERHADPTIKIVAVCSLCSEPMRRGTLVVDGDYMHKVCYAEMCSDY